MYSQNASNSHPFERYPFFYEQKGSWLRKEKERGGKSGRMVHY